MTLLTGLFKAIRHYGSQKNLAKALGRPRQTITSWINRDEKIPDLYAALDLFAQLKGSIPLKELVEKDDQLLKLLDSVFLFDKCPAVEITIDKIQIINTCPIRKTSQKSFELTCSELSLPILIDTANRLITCECRLHANVLSKQKTVFVHQLDLKKLINKTITIEPLLKILPISEKVAIALAIERELGNRQGRRRDLEVQPRIMGLKNNLQLVQNSAQVKRGMKTRELIADIAGFNNHCTYSQAKEVVMKGVSELIQAMDQQRCTIFRAKNIAKLPQAEQYQALDNLKDPKLTDEPPWRYS